MTKKYKFLSPAEIYDAIRTHQGLTVSQKEKLLSYLNPDIEKKSVTDLELGYDEFIGFADYLKDNIKTIAKLLYFGGNRSLNEILNLKIKDVNFHKMLITYDTQVVSYPIHIFVDIRTIIGKRTKGKIFLGRQDAPLSATTVFRNFKKAGNKAGLGSNFTPSCLTKNITNSMIKIV